MEEVTRQSSIARRPITLLDLQEVQRDSNYQETQLITKLKQGREAGKAFGFQRRLPAVVIGFLFAMAGACVRSFVIVCSCCIVRHIDLS